MRNLLDVPYHRLLERVADATTKQRAAAAAGPGAASSATEGTLWVDRYRPARFVDLLGDERVHRDTLAWVKEWDFCVFGKRRAKGKAPKRAWGDDAEKPAEGEYAKDEYQRPREKILLLAGPPGLGKTTLAHVVAKQAGYRVFEINARLEWNRAARVYRTLTRDTSDARSGQVVEERIRPALESGARIGSSKPSLVIIDEIDGATGAGDSVSRHCMPSMNRPNLSTVKYLRPEAGRADSRPKKEEV
jgi:chromosome transmission fidelity protein 18